MSHEPQLTAPLSRPKIHRLPARAQAKSIAVRSKPYSKPALFGSYVIIATLLLAVLLNGFAALVAYHIDRLPKNNVTAMTDNGAILRPISDAQASEQLKSIVIDDGSQAIIGQMAKMSPSAGAMDNVETKSDIDKSANGELLSIVSKH